MRKYKGKTLGKRRAPTAAAVEEEIKKEIRKESKRGAQSIMKELMGSDVSNLLPTQIAQLRAQLKQHQTRGVNIGYIKTVLFPEQFTYDIPLPLSSISYCKFTDKQEVTINTGPVGQGMLVWYPRVNGGPQLFLFHADNVAPTTADPFRYNVGLPSQAGIPIVGGGSFFDSAIYEGGTKAVRLKYWKVGLPQYAFNNFTQTALVGASLSVQYVGKVESESGLMVGGHVYGVPISSLTQDDIENAQWVTRARPGEGLRFLFLPKDQTDYEFYPCQSGQAYSQGAAAGTDTANSKLIPTEWTPNIPASLTGEGAFQMISGGMTAADSWYRKDNNAAMMNVGGISYSNNTNFVAIYWTGMEPNRDWLRLDCIRKFCGIPTQKTRDIVELTRPMKVFDSNKTFGVLNMLCNTSPIGGHTLKEVDRVIDNLMDVLPNLGYVLDNGGIGQVRTLDELVDILNDPIERAKQLEGQLQGSTKRMYKYFV